MSRLIYALAWSVFKVKILKFDILIFLQEKEYLLGHQQFFVDIFFFFFFFFFGGGGLFSGVEVHNWNKFWGYAKFEYHFGFA